MVERNQIYNSVKYRAKEQYKTNHLETDIPSFDSVPIYNILLFRIRNKLRAIMKGKK